jgi:hypothetical protein
MKTIDELKKEVWNKAFKLSYEIPHARGMVSQNCRVNMKLIRKCGKC